MESIQVSCSITARKGERKILRFICEHELKMLLLIGVSGVLAFPMAYNVPITIWGVPVAAFRFYPECISLTFIFFYIFPYLSGLYPPFFFVLLKDERDGWMDG